MKDSIRLKSINNYWKKRLSLCQEALKENGFDARVVQNQEEAVTLILEELIPRHQPKIVSWGDSLTFLSLGILEELKKREEYQIVEIEGEGISWEESMEARRKALLSDLFFTGTNAVTEDGMLVNLDMIGNRVAGITFGPRQVVIVVGRNKITADLDAAMARVKDYASPVNASRFNLKTPCVKTSLCHDCSSADRICNVWTITEKSFPKGRITVILINQDLGF